METKPTQGVRVQRRRERISSVFIQNTAVPEATQFGFKPICVGLLSYATSSALMTTAANLCSLGAGLKLRREERGRWESLELGKEARACQMGEERHAVLRRGWRGATEKDVLSMASKARLARPVSLPPHWTAPALCSCAPTLGLPPFRCCPHLGTPPSSGHFHMLSFISAVFTPHC